MPRELSPRPWQSLRLRAEHRRGAPPPEARAVDAAIAAPDPDAVPPAGDQAAASHDPRAGRGARAGGDGEPAARGSAGRGDQVDRGDRAGGGRRTTEARGSPEGDRHRALLRGLLRRRRGAPIATGRGAGGPPDREHAHRVAGPLRPPALAAADDRDRRSHHGDRRGAHPEPGRRRAAARVARRRGGDGTVAARECRGGAGSRAVARPPGRRFARHHGVLAHPAAAARAREHAGGRDGARPPEAAAEPPVPGAGPADGPHAGGGLAPPGDHPRSLAASRPTSCPTSS